MTARDLSAEMEVSKVFAKLTLFFLLTVTACYANNTVAVFACPSKPVPGQDCLSRVFPNGDSRNIGMNDYYDLLINSVCIDEPDSWWSQRLISLSATVSLASSPNPVKMPVYNERAAGSGCRIGINLFGLYTSIPANGTPVAVQVDVMRSDAQDGLKQLLTFATAQESNPSLTTYAAEAVPYVSMGLSFANQVYSAFSQPTTPEIPMTPTTLAPYSGIEENRNDLRDGYLVEYSGPDNPKDGDFYVDAGGDLHWSGNDSLVRGSAAWVVLRIEKREHRTDYVLRPWYTQWYALLEKVVQGAGGAPTVDATTFQKTTSDCLVLLEADSDFTAGDKRRFVNAYTAVEASIVAQLQQHQPDYTAIGQSVQNALDTIQLIQPQPHGGVVTASNTQHPTVTVAEAKNLTTKQAIVPEKLAQQLQTLLQRR